MGNISYSAGKKPDLNNYYKAYKGGNLTKEQLQFVNNNPNDYYLNIVVRCSLDK